MAKLNPYKNTANELVTKRGVSSLKRYLHQKKANRSLITDEIVENIEMFIELSKHVAFDEGRKQGNFETAQALKAILDAEDPEFQDANEERHF
jgi:hypothetical protein